MELGPQPHALMFPFPAQGHINPMLQLAKMLLSSGFFITFVNTDFNHDRIFQNKDSQALLQLPNLRFDHLPDGLPPSHGRFNQDVVETVAAILTLPGPMAKLVEKIMAAPGPPVTCIIVDSFCSWMQDVADKFGIPRVSLWTTPVHGTLAYRFQSTLISEGYIPLKDKQTISKIITCVPGVDPMPLCDFVSFFLVEDSSDYLFQFFLVQGMKRSNEAIWNLGNNFVELESKAVDAFRKEVGNFLPIGPLLPEAVMKGEGSGGGAAGLNVWEEDSACEEWLDEQEEGSVLFVSFGSIVSMEAEELEEIVAGIEESDAPFLCAVRPDQGGEAMEGLRKRYATAELGQRRALVVDWAPQLAVLCHKAVGGFLTHCGWNSVLESICAGVPILAKPGRFAEQCMNAHYVANCWRVGLRLDPPTLSSSPRLTRAVVKEQIRLLLRPSPISSAFRSRLARIRQATLASASPRSNFNHFVQDIRSRAARAASPSS